MYGETSIAVKLASTFGEFLKRRNEGGRIEGLVWKRLTVRDQFVGILLKQVEMVDHGSGQFGRGDEALPVGDRAPLRVRIDFLAGDWQSCTGASLEKLGERPF